MTWNINLNYKLSDIELGWLIFINFLMNFETVIETMIVKSLFSEVPYLFKMEIYKNMRESTASSFAQVRTICMKAYGYLAHHIRMHSTC